MFTVEQWINICVMCILGFGSLVCGLYGWIKGEQPRWLFRLCTGVGGLLSATTVAYLLTR